MANGVISNLATQPASVSALPRKRNPSASVCKPYRELIELGLSRGCNAMAIWQDLVSEAGFASG
jgi:hypothetical protein